MKRFTIRNLLKVFVQSFKLWYQRDPFKESSVIAYNMIFSLPGLLVIVVTAAGYFFGQELVSGKLHEQIGTVMGKDTADSVQQIILLAFKRDESWIATIIAVATIILGATGVFVQMQKSLNAIWHVEANTKKTGILNLIRIRLFSFGLIISIAFILLASLVLSSLLTALSDWVTQYWSQRLYFVMQGLNFIVSTGLITLLFALMFKILPDAKIPWKDVWIGAFVTALLFVIGKSALGFYFGQANPASGYGAAGSVVLILLWASYTSMIVFYGAQFTKVFADFFYGEVPPMDHAIKQKEVTI